MEKISDIAWNYVEFSVAVNGTVEIIPKLCSHKFSRTFDFENYRIRINSDRAIKKFLDDIEILRQIQYELGECALCRFINRVETLARDARLFISVDYYYNRYIDADEISVEFLGIGGTYYFDRNFKLRRVDLL